MLEQLLMSIMVIVLGMGTVFVALIALICVIEFMNKILNASQHKSKKETGPADKDINQTGSASMNISPSTTSESINAETDDEEELIAVITAAIAASLNRSTHDIIVRSVKRIPYNSPVWNITGRNQQIAGRL